MQIKVLWAAHKYSNWVNKRKTYDCVRSFSSRIYFDLKCIICIGKLNIFRQCFEIVKLSMQSHVGGLKKYIYSRYWQSYRKCKVLFRICLRTRLFIIILQGFSKCIGLMYSASFEKYLYATQKLLVFELNQWTHMFSKLYIV